MSLKCTQKVKNCTFILRSQGTKPSQQAYLCLPLVMFINKSLSWSEFQSIWISSCKCSDKGLLQNGSDSDVYSLTGLKRYLSCHLLLFLKIHSQILLVLFANILFRIIASEFISDLSFFGCLFYKMRLMQIYFINLFKKFFLGVHTDSLILSPF